MHNKITEGLEYQDMEGLIKPTVHIDEFESKMGDEEDICVISFYLRNSKAATDLVSFFEKGYEFILDAERSPGEVKPNRYLVYVELKRRSSVIDWLEELLTDLGTLCEYETVHEWEVSYKEQTMAFNKDTLKDMLVLSPKEYREIKELELNEMRMVAGLPTKRVFENDAKIKAYASLAGL